MDFLLQQHEQRLKKVSGSSSYVNAADRYGCTPVVGSIEDCRSCAPRVVRRLIDAGADTASAVRVRDIPGGQETFNGTPMALTIRGLRVKKVCGEAATEEQQNALEGIRRLLWRVEAVRATSGLWRSHISSIIDAAKEQPEIKITSTWLRMTLPALRRRARRRGVVLAALFRWGAYRCC